MKMAAPFLLLRQRRKMPPTRCCYPYKNARRERTLYLHSSFFLTDTVKIETSHHKYQQHMPFFDLAS